MAGLDNEGVFQPYGSPTVADLGDEVHHGGWLTDRYLVFVVAWNTDRVPRGEEPRSLEDLADPRWRGRIGVEASNADWYKTVRDHWIAEGKSEEEADRILEGIARNSRIADSNAVMTELLGAGDFDVLATSYKHLVKRIAGEGAPIAVEPFVEPVYTRTTGIGMLKGAQNPAAAMLLIDYVLGEGQKVFEESGFEPVRDLDQVKAEQVPVDVETFADEAREWQDRYDELLRLAGRGG
jgi:iron(III) transport system substrate-binding protein